MIINFLLIDTQANISFQRNRFVRKYQDPQYYLSEATLEEDSAKIQYLMT